MRAVLLFMVFTAFERIRLILCCKAQHPASAGHINNETRLLCLGAAGPGGGLREKYTGNLCYFPLVFFESCSTCFVIFRLIIVLIRFSLL